MSDNKTNPLLSFVEQVSGDDYLKIEEDLGSGFVRLKTSEAERRQAKHDIRSIEDVIIELLRNSRDASSSRIYIANSTEGTKRSITIIDNGEGVPGDQKTKIFEARVTSKLETMSMDEWGVHGRGMALFSIRENVEEISLIETRDKGGSAFRIISDSTKLKELSDQSRFPKVARQDGEVVIESGPHNLIRKSAEFALMHPEVEVYIGTPSEIAATLYEHSKSRYKSFAEAIKDNNDPYDMAIWERLSSAEDAAELALAANSIGLELSTRNAYRILKGEISAIRDLATRLEDQLDPVSSNPDIYKDARGLKLDKADLDDFSLELENVFDDIAEKYYLSLNGDIKIRVGKNSIKVSFPFEKE